MVFRVLRFSLFRGFFSFFLFGFGFVEFRLRSFVKGFFVVKRLVIMRG